MPYLSPVALTIAADDIVADPDAVTLIVGDVLALEGFVTSKPNVYVVPAVMFPTTVKVSVPELQAPFPVVLPFEKVISPSSPASIRSTVAEADAPASPDMVTLELSASFNVVSVTSVTVILFVCPGTGVLWPIARVVNSWADTGRRCINANNSKNIGTPDGRRRLLRERSQRGHFLLNVQ